VHRQLSSKISLESFRGTNKKSDNYIQFIIHRSQLEKATNKGRTKMLSGCKN